MTHRSFRFALVGCGHMGATADDRAAQWADAAWWLPLSHASAIQATEGADLVAVCDVREAAARAAAERFHVPACYTDFQQLLARETPDAVAIATRTPERRALIEASLAAGVKAIFCEKPLSQTLEGTDALCASLEQSGAAFVYGTRRRFMPIYRHVQAQIAAGRIGEIQTILVRFGTSPLLWTHPHSVDIASFFAGDPMVEYVQADLTLDPALVSADCVDADPVVRHAAIRFHNGIGAFLLPSDSMDVEIIGTLGSVTVQANGRALEWRERRLTPAGRIDLSSHAETRREENTDHLSGTVQSIRTLVAALRGEPAELYSPRLAVRNQETLFAFVESHLDGGRRCPLPVPRRGLTITGRIGQLYP